MKKFIKAVCLIFLFCFSMSYTTVFADGDAPDINAEGSILIDAESGTVLFGKNENKTFEPASTTKVMTALITLEKCKLDEEVEVTQNFTEIDGTAIGLLKGDKLTVRDLLLGLLMESGNDCANALAIHISGSVESFGQLMTERAKEFGATNTTFKNPSGLPDDEHITTPHDLALIMREAIKNKDFIELTEVPYHEIKMINNKERVLIVNNKNYMINKNSRYYYEYAISGKNGYTLKANHTYVCAAEKDGHRLVASYLNATNKPQNFQDMKDVFDYGFNNYTWVSLYKGNEVVENYKVKSGVEIPLKASQNVDFVIPNGGNSDIKKSITTEQKDLSKTSFKAGDKILKATVSVDGKKYMTIDLLAGQSYEYTPIISKKNFPVLSVVAGAVTGAVLIGISLIYIKKKKS